MHSYIIKLSNQGGYWRVLILVLMEDALVQLEKDGDYAIRWASLNPCFNGRCTRTYLALLMLVHRKDMS